MPQILVVCTANICRSPVGEALIRDRLQTRGLTDWTVRSAGTWAMQKRGASRNSIIVLQQAGIELADHESHMITEEDMRQADLILCMENGHAEALRAEFYEEGSKVFLISEMIGRSYNVSDPYGSSLANYERMGAELTSIIDNGMDRIIELAKANSTESPAS